MSNCKNCGKILAKHMKVTCSKKCSGKIGADGRPRKHKRITNGYTEIYKPESGRKNGWVREHIWVVSESIGRPVKYPENVHHIDGNTQNNDIDNLLLCSGVSEHTKIHHSMERVLCELLHKGIVKFDREQRKYLVNEEAVANLWLKLRE